MSDPIEPVGEIVQTPVIKYVRIDENQLNELIHQKNQLETAAFQFKQDLVNVIGGTMVLFHAIRNTKGLISIIPVTKIAKAAVKGEMPEFSAEEILKLIEKAKTKVFTDPHVPVQLATLIEILNRYLPLFQIEPVSQEVINQILDHE